MPKVKTIYVCQSCGAKSSKWAGKCNSCGEWNTLVEEIEEKQKTTSQDFLLTSRDNTSKKPISILDVEEDHIHRIITKSKEFNRVLGGGIVPGSLVLIGGDPGIGKSTLLLQIALSLEDLNILYISGEESVSQIKLRSERLFKTNNEKCYILTENQTQYIFQQAKILSPDLIIVDSIQTVFTNMIESSPGSISQVRECTHEFQKYAKFNHIPIFLVGHINKEGNIAGPKVLEHIVDTVLQFEGDRNHAYRILRTTKNRFGSTSELGIYEMHGNGLKEIKNPSQILLSQRDDDLSGISVGASIEGVRPMLIETQALVSPAVYGTPQRSSTGYDLRRLNMLLAVLEKRGGFKLGLKDVFLNITGGIRIEDPSIDLSIIVSILSSHEDIYIPYKYCFAGEVGLSGEVRSISRLEERVTEAEKLGFEKIFISKYNSSLENKHDIDIVTVGKVEEIYKLLFS